MIGRNPLLVAKEHGHGILTMLTVYAAWTGESTEADIRAIRRARARRRTRQAGGRDGAKRKANWAMDWPAEWHRGDTKSESRQRLGLAERTGLYEPCKLMKGRQFSRASSSHSPRDTPKNVWLLEALSGTQWSSPDQRKSVKRNRRG